MSIPETATRCSPIHHLCEALGAHTRIVNGVSLAVRFRSDEEEQGAKATLGVCDLSGLSKLGIQGRDAERWLAQQNIDVPGRIHDAIRTADGGLIVRLAADEFLLESGLDASSLTALAERLRSDAGDAFPVERQEATFLLVGSQANDVLRQMCAVNFLGVPPRRLILTRVAGISCGVLRNTIDGLADFRMWVDFSYAVSLWQTLLEICQSLDGCAIGAGAIFAELRQ